MFCDYINVFILVLKCCALNCITAWSGNQEESVSIHKFPKYAVLLQKWLLEIPRKDWTRTK